jgi:hypothetical protein
MADGYCKVYGVGIPVAHNNRHQKKRPGMICQDAMLFVLE